MQTNSTIQCFLTMFTNLLQSLCSLESYECRQHMLPVCDGGKLFYSMFQFPWNHYQDKSLECFVLFSFVGYGFVVFCFVLNVLCRKSDLQEFLFISRTWRGEEGSRGRNLGCFGVFFKIQNRSQQESINQTTTCCKEFS